MGDFASPIHTLEREAADATPPAPERDAHLRSFFGRDPASALDIGPRYTRVYLPGGPAAMTWAQRPAGGRNPAPPTSAGSPRKPDARTGRARARRVPLLPVLALLLGALSLFAAATAEAQAPTRPGQPRNVQATPGNNSVTLTWQAPSSWGTWNADGYEVLIDVDPTTGTRFEGVKGDRTALQSTSTTSTSAQRF